MKNHEHTSHKTGHRNGQIHLDGFDVTSELEKDPRKPTQEDSAGRRLWSSESGLEPSRSVKSLWARPAGTSEYSADILNITLASEI